MIHDNNPCNLKASAVAWVGKIHPSGRPDFEAFDTLENGVRAGARNFLTKQRVYGLRSVAALIGDPVHGHAPHTASGNGDENPNLAAYVCFCAARLRVGNHDAVDLSDLRTLELFADAVTRFETGESVPVEVIRSGCARALRP